eukprot:gnl/Spiro4/15035_TR8103_c0_g1_i1.p2 gnl/Spiro4/15035_TR8103_c0_g1~~gnl/Spiro4/15035_TR8103_c0_g1_i1.p2  ORF type:complete len:104 (+),score=6.23 gnl/Spiro4/15035_TR8103_c0_g1_i1:60-371(+)
MNANRAYVSADGQLVEPRRFYQLSPPEMFWGVVNFFGLFFRTILDPTATFERRETRTMGGVHGSTQYGAGRPLGGGGGGGGGFSEMRNIRARPTSMNVRMGGG